MYWDNQGFRSLFELRHYLVKIIETITYPVGKKKHIPDKEERVNKDYGNIEIGGLCCTIADKATTFHADIKYGHWFLPQWLHLPDNGLRKAVEEDPGVCASSTHVKDSHKAAGSGLQSSPALPVWPSGK